jgi:nitroreductase
MTDVLDRVDVTSHRHPSTHIEPLLYHRWSPRAMSGEPISDRELHRLFEAARWAPSSFNEQPWRFLYARREGPHWDLFVDLLDQFNQRWAKKAAVLMLIISRTRNHQNGEVNRTHSFDTGASWQNLALQANSMGLVVHGMAGFDVERARQRLRVPEYYAIDAMAAVGRPGRIEDLPDGMRRREKPSGRKRVREIACEGPFLP